MSSSAHPCNEEMRYPVACHSDNTPAQGMDSFAIDLNPNASVVQRLSVLLYMHTLINPRRACAARVAVVVVCVCH